MPYIDQGARNRLEHFLKAMHLTEVNNAGELNYLITCLVQTYIVNRGDGVNYQGFNDAIGALEGAKLELYRRAAAPYEDGKMVQNGEVMESKLASGSTPFWDDDKE